MSANEYMEQFSPHLFWDVRKEDIDLDAHAQYVIQRVLEYGLLGDWNLIKSYYGLPKIVETAKGLRSLEPRALAYIAAISKTPKEQFRCYTWKQLNPQPGTPEKLQRLPVLEQTRLVGGTALALQLGHRKSIDLDFSAR